MWGRGDKLQWWVHRDWHGEGAGVLAVTMENMRVRWGGRCRAWGAGRGAHPQRGGGEEGQEGLMPPQRDGGLQLQGEGKQQHLLGPQWLLF